jgi:ABC-type branched-subunit amino acid transport system ATPase component
LSENAVPASAEPILTCAGVSLTIGGIKAVRQVAFTVGAGEIVAIIGPNGAGKSSLLNCITGHYQATAGQISLGSVRIDELPPFRRSVLGIGRTFQQPELIKGLSVIDNVMLGGHATFSARRRRRFFDTSGERTLRAEARAACATVGLDDRMDGWADQLPHGKRRLLELARCLVQRPAVLLLDEPASGMSGPEKVGLLALLRRIREELGCGMVVVEHDLGFVMELADRVCALQDGAVIASGPAREVLAGVQVRSSYFRTKPVN